MPGQVPLEDKPCLYDTSLPQCAPVDGKCRDGYGTNENGRCFPQHSKCPDGYHGHEDDESGECIPNKIPCSQGYTVHMSFKDIGAIIRRIDGQANDNDINLSNKSKATQALHLFKNGRKPIDVAIDLDIPYDEVTELEREYWALNQLYELPLVYQELKYDFDSFFELFKILKRNKMLSEKYIMKFLRYANEDLPTLEKRCQQLSDDVLELQFRKKKLGDEVATQCSSITQLEKSLNWYKMEITIAPPPLFIICGISYFIDNHTPLTFTFMI